MNLFCRYMYWTPFIGVRVGDRFLIENSCDLLSLFGKY